MRARAIVVMMLLMGCGGSGGNGAHDAAPYDTSPPGADAGCPAYTITITGDVVPGATVMLSLTPATTASVMWNVSLGTVTAAGAWTIPSDVANDVAATATVDAVIGTGGCHAPPQLSLTIDWPAANRTIVLYNSMAAGSQDVANYYAAFRAIPATQICDAPSAELTSITSAEYDAWLDTVMTCVEAAGPHIHTIVPTYGVAYKVQGRIGDLANPATPVETSLDALLVYGRAGAMLSQTTNNPLDQNAQPLAGLYAPYVPFGAWKSTHAAAYYLVARIDGADAAAAMALVDRTAAAETLAQMHMLSGTVYVDGNEGLPHPSSADFGTYQGGEWSIIGVENVFTALGTYPVVANYDNAELGTAPAPLSAPDALYYAGWYSYGTYNDVFTWNVGAIGGHLDSCSACDIRQGPDWSAQALAHGITATFGAVNEPYVAGMPEYDQFFRILTSGASYGEAAYESSVIGAWMLVFVGDPLYRPYPAP